MADTTTTQAGAASESGVAVTGGTAPSKAVADRPVKIIGIVCNWCSYAGADTAGVGRFRQPPNLRLVQVPCTGRIDPLFALRLSRKALTVCSSVAATG